MCDSWVPPSPNINVGHNLESRTPTDQHWLWGEGFSDFLSLSQILCTWLSEFWLKICYFVESVKSLLLLRGGSNQVWAWPKTIKITFYDMNHLTPLWPPRSHGGSPSLWNLSLCIKNLCPCNWMESAGLVGCCKHLSSIFGVVNVPHCGLNCQYKTYGYIFTAILFSNDMVLYFMQRNDGKMEFWGFWGQNDPYSITWVKHFSHKMCKWSKTTKKSFERDKTEQKLIFD